MSKYEEWIDQIIPKQERVTDAVIAITKNLLRSERIDYLSVNGRTKTKASVLEKIKRKGYKDPSKQITDLSGIRIVVYFESDVKKLSDLISRSFSVDNENSMNQDARLSVDQIGYRSVHFVCDLGKERVKLPEFSGLEDLKFEFQVRTILQHAWAELAHDRNYKFSGKLPIDIERSLFLYAGMLEIADKGFDELSRRIDSYIESVHKQTQEGDLDFSLDSISLPEFVESWAKSQGIALVENHHRMEYDILLSELRAIDITTASELQAIIPKGYPEIYKSENYVSTIYGVVRDWMLISDWRKYLERVNPNWLMVKEHIFDHFFKPDEFEEFCNSFEWEIGGQYEWGED